MRFHRVPALPFGLVPLALAVCAATVFAESPPREPARVDVVPSSRAVAPGEGVEITLRVVPGDGVKINRYPKIKVRVPAVDGLTDEAVAEHGNPKPPPPDDMSSNYFGEPEPIRMTIPVSASARPGDHEVSGEIRYFYCVAASGFCAPASARVTIPLTVR
jgi:hypothetical protein